jgi:hypothetical protein
LINKKDLIKWSISQVLQAELHLVVPE